jgi:hypothetical protein
MSDCIIYISGGLLGDFIHQLSVICEMYHKTNKKGILYITDTVGDIFRTGVENTYLETKKIVEEQEYIKEYKIHNGENYDINLSKWRQSPYLYQCNLYILFNRVYDVEWGSHKWLTAPINENYSNKIIITHSLQRWGDINIYRDIINKFNLNDILYIYWMNEEYSLFKEQTGFELQSYKCNNIYELITILNSCKLHIGNFSTPLTISFALKHPSIGLSYNSINDQILFQNLPDMATKIILDSSDIHKINQTTSDY